jgi:hypothetical protein
MMSLFAGCFVDWNCYLKEIIKQYELFVSYFIATVLHCFGKLLASRADCLLLLFFKLWDVYSYYLSRYLPIYVALFAAMVKMLLACESHFDPPVIVIMHLLWNSRSTKLFIVLCHSDSVLSLTVPLTRPCWWCSRQASGAGFLVASPILLI